ncbi:NADH-quinone oxidoreductase subunit NuoE family protein [Solemya velum gill symbiont]|uniref:NADH-quinone oxidoreductase subunit NuoE family protein n=1 Tax=Solemya velum gill symbiont TaxID=2340 RepID=UPI000998277D|nr:NAD(P)H-dependent oxidoreductase subunit E [Solemya velum gill symbiont]OOZ45668.1 NAD(P)H-dependent oxidoreductase subunit E [Solemya velum gill symbiont]OOZ46926.1 NAD(P)H-dependent oxidoreductase subunit E [Solemya velum gill symbiont]OOZ48716.1 NAD(P)H-dependent oxidoreductase subunit E [Solemya velum gill symbiont]OOZ52025.1 NAD(P)H-dependent oxidoreductase subunit E [Solemya velum gill symbiont]OOZ54716.1 NAD(P)H-dependent oxidoreductase subunit E [Solemya velum gill symbiont]
MKIDKTSLFIDEVRAEIDKHIAKYPADWKQSACMPALTAVQEMNGGWLTRELMDQVAAYLDMPAIAVYEVATFYSMYEHKEVGRHKICLCTNISCMVNNSDSILEHLNKRLGISFGEVTDDGKFSIKEVECLGACGGAPMMQIGDHYYENLTPEKIDSILEELE